MTRRPTSAARREEGMTLIEVMVAAVILVVGILSLLTVISTSGQLTTRSERESQAVDFAEQQVETLRSLPYASIALSTCAGDATWTRLETASDPWYIAPLASETAVSPCNTGKIAPTGTWQDNVMAVRGNVYRYVTQVSASVKRIVVAVTDGGAGGLTRPVAVSALVPDPNAGNSSGTLITGAGSPCFIVGLICLS